MSESSPAKDTLSASRTRSGDVAPSRVLLVPYPKIVFLYPLFLASIVAGILQSLFHQPLDPPGTIPVLVGVVFFDILILNIAILAFEFPRTTSLTLFFFALALVLGLVLLFKFRPEVFPLMTNLLHQFKPVANATFYWAFAGTLGAIFLVVLVVARFDYWEVRPNELLHHHGFLSNLERFSAPNLRIDKEINDVFEYMLLRSGRLILQASNERRAIVLDNIPFIGKKEEAITHMLSALQVEVRKD